MSEKIKKISTDNLPMGLGLEDMLLYWLAMDYYDAPEWLWGAVTGFCALWVVFWFILYVLSDKIERIDIFKK